jgi:hypothetical protein
MNELNEIETIKTKNCTIHICDNAIGTKEEQEKCWKDFSRIAYELYTTNNKKCGKR